MKRILMAAVAGAALTFGWTGTAGMAWAADINLKMAHFLPTANGMHRDFLEPWARKLEACSGGKVAVEIFPAGTQLGNIAKLYDSVSAGVVDIAHGLHGIPAGRFPKTRIIDLPFLTESADAASRALWDLYPTYLADEYPGVKVLGLHAHNGGLIHTKDKQVTKMEDLKGLRIRFPSPAIKAMLEYLGAVPQGLPPGKVYENMQKGVIDGTVFPWDPMQSFKLAEVVNYHLDARAYTVSFWFAMNQGTYDGLPDDVRGCVDSLSGDYLADKFGLWWDRWDGWGLKASLKQRSVLTELSDEERARWREALTPMIDEWLANMEKDGVANAREIYQAFQERIAHYEDGN